jgi:hypothetical protein
MLLPAENPMAPQSKYVTPRSRKNDTSARLSLPSKRITDSVFSAYESFRSSRTCAVTKWLIDKRNRTGQRYRAIQEYILENESRCILLSATPYNKTYLDLSNQLRLFVPEDKDLGIRPEQLLRGCPTDR